MTGVKINVSLNCRGIKIHSTTNTNCHVTFHLLKSGGSSVSTVQDNHFIFLYNVKHCTFHSCVRQSASSLAPFSNVTEKNLYPGTQRRKRPSVELYLCVTERTNTRDQHHRAERARFACVQLDLLPYFKFK